MSLLPYVRAKAQRALLRSSEHGVTLLVSPRTLSWAISEVRQRHALVSLESVRDNELDTLLASAYSDTDSAVVVVGAAESEVDLDRLMDDIPEVTDLLDTQGGAPVIRMINAPLIQAARDGASDIRIKPFETHLAVRYRIDGALHDVAASRKMPHAALMSRIKIMAQLDIAEKRLPQDGRTTLWIAGRPIDIRVSTAPTGYGKRVVVRLLDKQAERLRLETLGMAPSVLAPLDNLTRQPHGIVLVIGLIGSGKTTTLYAALARLDVSTSNILTVEDPVEHDLPGVNQTQVNARIDVTFAVALRATLRQDPDIIMIGETRDLETAQIAVQASFTGHLVLTTLHTNDAVLAVARLVDMGVEPFLFASSILGVPTQCLVRRLCMHCRTEEDGGWRAVGCPARNQTGHSGRTGTHELFAIDDEIRRLVHQGHVEQDLREAARAAGMRSMREDGECWIVSDSTILEEILRATRDA